MERSRCWNLDLTEYRPAVMPGWQMAHRPFVIHALGEVRSIGLICDIDASKVTSMVEQVGT